MPLGYALNWKKKKKKKKKKTGTPEGSTESGFMENSGIEPATPGLQGIALIHYATGDHLLEKG